MKTKHLTDLVLHKSIILSITCFTFCFFGFYTRDQTFEIHKCKNVIVVRRDGFKTKNRINRRMTFIIIRSTQNKDRQLNKSDFHIWMVNLSMKQQQNHVFLKIAVWAFVDWPPRYPVDFLS